MVRGVGVVAGVCAKADTTLTMLMRGNTKTASRGRHRIICVDMHGTVHPISEAASGDTVAIRLRSACERHGRAANDRLPHEADEQIEFVFSDGEVRREAQGIFAAVNDAEAMLAKRLFN